jgi:alpha-galactosidase
MALETLASHSLGPSTLRYTRCPRTGVVEFTCSPAALADSLVAPREFDEGPHIAGLPERWKPVRSHEPEWLIALKTASTPLPRGHQAMRSLRGEWDAEGLRFVSHQALPLADSESSGLTIETVLETEAGLRLTHRVIWRTGAACFQVMVEAKNTGEAPVTIDYLPSFSLGGITPFHAAEAPEQLRLHRFRATWSAEGRHEVRFLEELNLERSWIGFSRRAERFGQRGSLPVREWFPWAALEDVKAGVFWGAHLPAPGSWHLEVGRTKNRVTLSGGLPCRDYGAWWLTLAPGESFTTPPATLACVAGDLDDLCHALVSAQIPAAEAQPASEHALPIIFNEWCSSWGEPTHEYVCATARVLAKHRLADILVIDDGWAAKPAGSDIQTNGDWEVDRSKFPGGLSATTTEIRRLGLVPGLWFEWENTTRGTAAYTMEDLQLHTDRSPVRVGNRHFWDLRNPAAEEYLVSRVLARLRDDGFGYLKIDYNETLPEGVDGEASSPGENLRQHLLAVQSFIRRMRREMPHLVIENCSSGGHRLEPSFQALCGMGSFSDAHETVAIPVIAANLHRLVLPRQSQVWCVIHNRDTLQRLRYGLAATFLGRMCISGDVKDLDETLLNEIASAVAFHRAAVPVIREGRSRVLQSLGLSWNEPRGWQAVIRHNAEGLLVVVHAFGGDLPAELRIPLPAGNWQESSSYATSDGTRVEGGCLVMPDFGNFTGAAWLGAAG